MNKVFLKSTFLMLCGNILSLLSGILVGFLVPKILGYEDYANYKIYSLYVNYLSILSLGIGDGIYLKFTGKELNENNINLLRLYVRFYYFQLLIIFVPAIIFGFFYFTSDLRFIFISLCFTLLSTNIVSLHQNLSLISSKFKEYTIRTIIKSVLISLLICLLFALYKFSSFKTNYKIYIIGTLLIEYILMSWYMYTYKDINFTKTKINHNLKNYILSYFHILILGLPLLLSNMAGTIFLNLDRQFVSILFDKVDYAIYAFAYNILTLITTMTSAVSLVVFPAIKNDKNFHLKNKFEPYTKYLAVFIAFSLLSYYPLVYVIEWFLPHYIQSLEIFRVVLPSVAFSTMISVLYINFYKSEKKINIYLLITLISIGVSCGLNFAAYYLTYDYLFISWASVLSIFIWYMLLSLYFVKKYDVKITKLTIFLLIAMVIFYIVSYFIKIPYLAFMVNLVCIVLVSLCYDFNMCKKVFLMTIKKQKKIFKTMLGNIHKIGLRNRDFTILSNNCTGGTIYEFFNLKKLSPTVGAFFMPSDFIKFLKELNFYLSQELKFIDVSSSANLKFLKTLPTFNENMIIGKLGDIEIVFLHYNSKEEVLAKRNRRCKRINLTNIIVKFNDQNNFDDSFFEEFKNLPYKNKIFCTASKKYVDSYDNLNVIYFSKDEKCGHVNNDMAKEINKYMNIKKYLNSISQGAKNENSYNCK